jgi:hypothetical protein
VPRWILALHGIAGGVLALTWLYTLPLQLRLVADAASVAQP